MPQISVIIPAYNCAAFIPATLESVFAQSYSDIEIIFVDDGSTDDTPTVLAPYLDRIIYIRQKNVGLPGARNTGIRAAKGEFIALLDADDSWMADKLEKQLPHFADAEVGIVYSDFSVRYSNGRFQPSYLVDRPLASEGYVLENYIRSRFLFPSTMLIRRKCFDDCGVFDEEMLACEDVELFARICSRWKVARVDAPLVIRYEGTHNITSNSRRVNQYTILALEKVLSKQPDLPPSTRKVINKELGQQHWWYGYAAFKDGNMAQTRQNLIASIRCDAHYIRAVAPILAVSFLPSFIVNLLHKLKSGEIESGANKPRTLPF